jgi:hypothetical protein
MPHGEGSDGDMRIAFLTYTDQNDYIKEVLESVPDQFGTLGFFSECLP